MNTHLTEIEIQELCEANDPVPQEHPHLNSCMVCRERFLFAKGLAGMLSDRGEEPIDEHFAEAIIARIRSTETELQETARKGRKSWVYLIGTVIGLVAMWFLLRPHIHTFILTDRPYEMQLIFTSIFTVSLFVVSELLSIRLNKNKSTISFSF
jgi:hypothetical protein